jgi:hypothetical protein
MVDQPGIKKLEATRLVWPHWNGVSYRALCHQEDRIDMSNETRGAKKAAEPEQDEALPQLPLWFDELAPGGTGEGFLERMPRHSLMFVKRIRPTLLVSFDNLSNVNDTSSERVPWAFKFAKDRHLSHLGVFAHAKMWYRDPQLIARFTSLRDAGFFDGYERVVFTGSSMGAFAALVFSSLVPGAHVLAFNPQSTLDPKLVPWEERYGMGRRQDWTIPLSDAKGALDKAGPVSVFYDPFFAPDRRHFERLDGPTVTGYKCWFSSHKSAVFLRKLDALGPIMTAGILGELTPKSFYSMYRGRRALPWYVSALEAYFRDSGRERMARQARAQFRRLKRKAQQQEAQKNG